METTQRVDPQKRLRLQLRRQIEWGRWCLLAILGISLVNQLLLAIGVDYHFLFSAAVPYYLNWLGRALGANADLGAFRVLAVILTMFVYAFYIACWLLSGQRKEWMLAALGLYGIDTLLLIIFSLTLLENSASCLLEILTHFICLFLLWGAFQASERLSRLPKQRRVPKKIQEERALHS